MKNTEDRGQGGVRGQGAESQGYGPEAPFTNLEASFIPSSRAKKFRVRMNRRPFQMAHETSALPVFSLPVARTSYS